MTSMPQTVRVNRQLQIIVTSSFRGWVQFTCGAIEGLAVSIPHSRVLVIRKCNGNCRSAVFDVAHATMPLPPEIHRMDSNPMISRQLVLKLMDKDCPLIRATEGDAVCIKLI